MRERGGIWAEKRRGKSQQSNLAAEEVPKKRSGSAVVQRT